MTSSWLPDFFPDNKYREARLAELYTDTQLILKEAKSTYDNFIQLLKVVNKEIAEVYKKANLTIPPVTDRDIFEGKKNLLKVNTTNTVISISSIVLDVVGVAAVGYLAPAATIMLVEAGVLAAETAATVLVSVLGMELLTVGGLLGGIFGVLIVGGTIVAVTFGIKALADWKARTQLRKGIYDMGQLRIKTKVALDRSKILCDSLASVKTTCQTLTKRLKGNDKFSDKDIQNLIKDAINPEIIKMENITEESTKQELERLDTERNSWTKEDQEGKDIISTESIPVFLNIAVGDPENSIPITPEGLKLIEIKGPHHLYPGMITTNKQLWPFCKTDNEASVIVVAFDNNGNILNEYPAVAESSALDRLTEDNTFTLIGNADNQPILINF
ncbi:hypothetical protein SAMN05444266_109243 [Chitinophaga jiangningensis]|uniref:Uncharacterized protein n=1 Tax=Chitinophaga jiangningensis TaxID=1419482 RepID=A0A1M7KBX8_9BACT|nr:hypothetical protein [Chitinophaga jiangningensis]SHM62760.1 hypothetical protein SAMN05444266_109243 [Chitinophaga jiangningensis]